MSAPDQVFVLRGPDGQDCWRVLLDGVVLPTDFTSRGAAMAGLEVERRRGSARLAPWRTKPELVEITDPAEWQPGDINERVRFRLLKMPCCGHLLCWINPRRPSHCPECGASIMRHDVASYTIHAADAWLSEHKKGRR